MWFDESGFLALGDQTRFIGGSETARDLLIATVNGRLAIEMEGHNNSPHIAFARISAGTVYTHFQTKARIFVLGREESRRRHKLVRFAEKRPVSHRALVQRFHHNPNLRWRITT
jgi:hypothetical protein